MKRILYLLSLTLFFAQCSGSASPTAVVDRQCGKHNGKQLYVGPKGGCYYINSNSNKEYVDRSECNC